MRQEGKQREDKEKSSHAHIERDEEDCTRHTGITTAHGNSKHQYFPSNKRLSAPTTAQDLKHDVLKHAHTAWDSHIRVN